MARLTVRPHREASRVYRKAGRVPATQGEIPGRCAGTDRFSASQFERGVSGRLGTRRSDGQASRATRSELAVLEHHVSDVPPTAEGVRPSRLAPTFAATPLQHRDAVVIAIAGELDIANAPRAGPPASGGRPRSSRVGRPHGLRVHRFERPLILLSYCRRLGGFAVCCTEGDAASQLFQLTGVADQRDGNRAPLQVFPSRGEALKALSLAARRQSTADSLRLASTRVAGSRPEEAPLTHHPPAG